MKILFCSLVRSKEKFLVDWHARIKEIKSLRPDWTLNVSLYENDSEDNSKEVLRNLDWSFCDWYKLTSEDLNRKYFIGGERERIMRLSAYRNICIWQFGDLDLVDRIIMNDVDCGFDPKEAVEIIEESLNWDVYSFASRDTRTGDSFYDRWATRLDSGETFWGDHEYDLNGDNPVYVTGNGFTCYNPEPFRCGFTFGYVNHRGQPYYEHTDPDDPLDVDAQERGLKPHDVENAVVCENFRVLGFGKMAFNGKYNTMHHRDEIWLKHTKEKSYDRS